MELHLDPEWIDNAEGVRDLAAACRAAGRLALDTEADSLHSYYHKVCLIQVTAAERTALVDPLALDRGAVDPLLEVLADPAITVLMHGADYDVRVLDRDYGATVRGLEDTQIVAQLLGEARTGLAFLLERELGVVLDKRHQRADWARRPLSVDLRAYAAADSAFLEELSARLGERLTQLGRRPWAMEEFRSLEAVRYSAGEPEPLAFEKLKGARRLRDAARDRLYTLYEWRENRARRLDRPPFKVLGVRQMMALAEKPPHDLAALARVPGLGPRFIRRSGRQVISCLHEPDSAPARQPRARGSQGSLEGRQLVQRLLAARDRVAAEAGLQAGLVCPRALVVAVAEHALANGGEIAGSALAGWRFGLLEAPFAEIVAATGG